MRQQIMTNETDAIVAILLCDVYGMLDGQMMAANPPQNPSFARHVKIRLAVGHAHIEAEYDGTGQSVVKSSNITLDTAENIHYIPLVVQGKTYYRLPTTSDEKELCEYPKGTFPCFLLHVPKNTFEVTGDCKIALCNVLTNAAFTDSEQDVWQKYSETNIKIQSI